MPAATSRSASAAPRTALLIIDMISDWRFPDCDRLLRGAAAIAPRIARLKARCRRAGVPVVYANDNLGRWHSDFRQLVESSLAAGGRGSQVTATLAPDEEDYFVLKPRHSAFFATPLDLLLQELRVQRLLATGVAGDQCVLVSVAAAHMQGYRVHVPADCIASLTDERHRRSLLHFEQVLQVPTTPSPRLRLAARR